MVGLRVYVNWFAVNTNSLCSKLSCANGIISKLRHFVPLSTLLQIYHALFFSHLNYACQIWGQKHNYNVERVFILQKRCLRIMTFSDYIAPSSEIFSRLSLLKISDHIRYLNISLAHRILTGFTPTRLKNLFSLNFYQHKPRTRGKQVRLLFRPSFRTFMYGTESITYSTIVQWNELQQRFPDYRLTDLSACELKVNLHNFLVSDY